MALAIDPIAHVGTIPGIDKSRAWRLSTIVARFGWDEAKDAYPEVRRLLQTIGTDAVRNVIGRDSWIRALQKRIVDDGVPEHVVVSDVRFLNEADWVENAGGYVVGVARVNEDGTTFESGVPRDHESEREIADVLAEADTIVVNDGTDAFRALVEGLPHWLSDIMPALDRQLGREDEVGPTTTYEVVSEQIRKAYE